MAVMPNGTYVSNVYDAYEEGRRSLCEAVASQPEREPMACGYLMELFSGKIV